jgi:ABC-2 type transport system ATP-binding protein
MGIFEALRKNLQRTPPSEGEATDDSEARGGSLESQDGREPSEEPVISTRHLAKRFGQEMAVQDLSFEVPRGMIFGFIGPSGSGKTTTIRLLTGFYKPTSGEALVLGEHPSHFSRTERARIGYMPQHFVLYPHLTAWQNLNFAASIYGVELRRNAKLRDLLDFVELTAHRSKVTHALSGGMRRRLMLAATLVHSPELLFLDEPTAGIDPLLRDKFWGYFRDLQKEGRTLFVTTQYVSEAAYCDLVALLVDGKLIALDTPEELRRHAFGGEALDVGSIEPLDAKTLALLNNFSFVRRVIRQDDTHMRIIVSEASTALPVLVEWYRRQDVEIKSIEEYKPPFDAVFVELVRQESAK